MDGLSEQNEEGEKRPDGEADEGKVDADANYLRTLTECEHHAIDQFDKTVLTLAAGAFAVSFAFLKDIVKPETITHKGWLITAWVCWIVSLLSTLFSFFCSHHAMRNAQKKYRQGVRRQSSLRGGWWGVAILWLNPNAGIAFIIGLIFMSMFVTINLNNGKDTAKSGSATIGANAGPTLAPATTAASNTATTAASNTATTAASIGSTATNTKSP